ncbi:MAG: hypothetical protein E7107_15865 [Prevotella sp.]|nr:hypothetical protein [Prevotella sp.]
MNAQQLKNSILQEAIEGRLVPQDPNDEPASVLLDKIRKEKARLVKEGKLKKKDLEEVPVTEDEKPFDIPSNWEWCKLGTIAAVLGGKRIPAGRKLSVENTGHIYIRVSDMKDNTVSTDNLQYVPEDIFPSISRYIIKKEDVYITVAGTIGRVGKIPPELDGANLTENADRLIFSLINQDWLIKCLESNIVQTQITDVTTKVGQPKLAILRIQTLLIPLPPLAEQKRIVAKIEELMPKVEEYGKAQDELDKLNAELPERLKKSILQEAIEGRLVPQDPNDEPASVLLDKIRKEKARLVKEGKLKKKDLEETPISEDEKSFDIPKHWGLVRLGEVTYNHGQKTPTEDFSYIDIGSIDNEHQKLNMTDNIIKAKDAPSRARKIVKRGDVLYATVRPYLHNLCIIDRDFDKEPIASTGFAVLNCINGVYNKFLFYYLLSPIFDAYANDGDNAKGMAYPAINDKKLYNGLVPIPPLAEQKRIVEKIEQLMNEIDKLKV